MNKKITRLRWLAATLMFVAAMVMPTTAWAQNTITPSMPSGNGTADSPYLISSAAELYWFAGLVNGDVSVCTGDVTRNTAACAKLTENIVVNGGDFSDYVTGKGYFSGWIFWTPIGKCQDNIYTGTFDGQNHTISGLYFDSASDYYPDASYDQDYIGRLSIGLFGYNEGTIKNVGVIKSCFIWNDDKVGGVCGYNMGTIDNCNNQSKVGGSGCVGGVCGENNKTITDCYNTGVVNGNNGSGGVCGYNALESSTITNCYNTGAVSGSSNVGGVCGSNSGTIGNCYYISGCNAEGTTFINEDGTSKTTDEFKSGEVAYLLQGSQSSSVWGQTIGIDNYPVLGGIPVYYRNEVYTNTYGTLIEGTQIITASSSPLIWYEFTPTESGTYQFSGTMTAGNLYVNTTMTADDYKDITSSPTYELTAGTTYYVAVSAEPGSYDLTITRLGTTTALDAVASPQIYAVDGRIVCAGECRIYDLLGRDVTRLNGSLHGVYVVKVGEAAVKVVVK